MKNKILIITDSIEGNKTGIGYYSLGLINALKNIYKERIFFFNRSDTPLFNFVITPLKLLFKFELVRVWFNILPLIFKNRSDIGYIINLSAHPHYFPFSQKEIFVVHDIIHVDYPQYLNHRYLSFSRLFFEKTLKEANKIITVSEYSKKRIIERFNIPETNIFTIFLPYFINRTQQREVKPRLLPKGKYLLNLNTIEPRKNILSIVIAYESLRKRGVHTHKLILAGKLGWKYQSLLTYINKSRYKNDIVMLGYVSEQEKKYLYTHADVFIFVPFAEGFGIPAYEALIYKCPAILSGTTSLPEIAGDGAHYVDPNSSNAITNGIIKIISNKMYRKSLIRKGEKYINKYKNNKNMLYKISELKKFLDL